MQLNSCTALPKTDGSSHGISLKQQTKCNVCVEAIRQSDVQANYEKPMILLIFYIFRGSSLKQQQLDFIVW